MHYRLLRFAGKYIIVNHKDKVGRNSLNAIRKASVCARIRFPGHVEPAVLMVWMVECLKKLIQKKSLY